jgi:hypothetical protein
VAVVPRPPLTAPDGVAALALPAGEHGEVSSSAVRAGRYEWMAPEAAAFAARTGAWVDADRYAAWLSPST